MSQYELIIPCHFGMESVLKNEIYDIGYEITEVSDGRVTLLGDEEAIARPGRTFFPRTPASGSPRQPA